VRRKGTHEGSSPDERERKVGRRKERRSERGRGFKEYGRELVAFADPRGKPFTYCVQKRGGGRCTNPEER